MKTMTTTYSKQGKASFRSKIIWGACSACVVVRRLLLILLLSALLTPLSALFTSCGHDDLVPPDVYVEEPEHYIEIKIAVPAANSLTRGNPLGGEEGNGREQGVLNEDIIHDINIYFYKEEVETNVDGKKVGLGMNSKPDTPISAHFFYNFNNKNDVENSELLPDTELTEHDQLENSVNPYYGTQYISLKFKCSEDFIDQANDINFLVVANIGKIQFTKGMTLGALRGLELSYFGNSWTNSYDAVSMNAEKMDYFLMSTAYNDDYEYGNQHTGTNKIKKSADGKQCLGTTTLQRLYARLDLWYNKSQIKTINDGGKTYKELDYQIVDKDGDESKNIMPTTLQHHVYLTNVLPVNIMQKPSHLFKKVTDGLNNFSSTDFSGWTSKYLWGGKESPNNIPTATSPNDRPTNYVMERHTLSKKTVKEITEMSEDEISAYDTDSLKTWYGNTRTSEVAKNILNTDNGKFAGFYDMERLKGDHDPDYGCNHISIISYANENTHPTDCFHSDYLTGMVFRGVYVPEKIYTGTNTTTSTITGVDGKETTVTTENLDTLNQSVESIDGGKIYRYSPTGPYSNEYPSQKLDPELQLEQNSLYFTNRDAAEKYAKANPGEEGIITEYTAIKHTDDKGNKKWGFICYYNVWLRHYNNEKAEYQENFPMEYATVRNNIYRLSVDFSGPGDPTPTMREPDTMKARIFVRKWNYREEDPIIF